MSIIKPMSMIDYSKFTKQELIECLQNVDKELYPDNYKQILKQISLVDENSAKQDDRPQNTQSSDDEIVNAVLDRMRYQKTTSWVTKGGLGVLGVILSAVAIRASGDSLYLFAIIPALLIHEMGHLLMMKCLGYKNLGIFFIPFFGALTVGLPVNPSKKKDAIVSMGGPGIGMLSSICFGVLFHFSHSKWLLYLTACSFVLNLFNLLPFLPLDGGRLWDSILASRNRLLSSAFKVICLLALLLLAIKLETPIIGLIGMALVAQMYAETVDRKVVSDLHLTKERVLVSGRERMLREMILSYHKYVKRGNEKKRIRFMADRTRILYDRMLSDSPSWLFSIVMGVGYFVVVGVALVFLGGIYAAKKKHGM